MDSFPKTNKLIPELIHNSEDILDSVYSRIKVNGILGEFGNDLNKDFKKLISLSTRRYKGTKIGNNLDGIVKTQQDDLNKFSKYIGEREIYKNANIIDHEKLKLNKNLNFQRKSQVTKIRDQIKVSTKYLNLKELIDQEKTLDKIKDKRVCYLPPFIKQRMENEKKQKEIEEKWKNDEGKGIFYQNGGNEEEIIQSLFDQDKQVLANFDETYQSYLNRVLSQVKKVEEKNKIEEKKREEDKKKGILPENTAKGTGKKKEKDEFERFDIREHPEINKINTLFFKDKKIKEEKKKVLTYNNVDYQRLFRYTNKGKAFKKRLNYDYHKDDPDQRETNEDENELKTENIIKTEASTDLKQKLDQKAKYFDKILQEKLPFFSDNEENNTNYLTRSRKSKRAATSSQDIDPFSKEFLKKDKLSQLKGFYELKKKQWKLEDKRNIKITGGENTTKKYINEFLKYIKSKDRDCQLYDDEYSLKEQKLNNHIIQFNMTLPKNKFFSKKKLTMYLDRYANQLEEKENEERLKEAIKKEKIEDKKMEELEEKKRLIICDSKKSNVTVNLNENRGFDGSCFNIKTEKIPIDEQYENFTKFKDNYKQEIKNKKLAQTQRILDKKSKRTLSIDNNFTKELKDNKKLLSERKPNNKEEDFDFENNIVFKFLRNDPERYKSCGYKKTFCKTSYN